MTKQVQKKRAAFTWGSLRRAVLCCALLFATLSASAQWSVGATAGYSHNTLSIHPGYAYDMHYQSRGGFTFGVPVKYQLKDWLALQSGLTILSKGYRMERSGAFRGIYNDVTNDYLQVPLMANFSFGGERLRGFFNAGGYLGYWLNSNIEGYTMPLFGVNSNDANRMFESGHYDQSVPFDSRRDNRIEAGLLAGAGISYKVSNRVTLELEARYYYSLTDMQKQYMKFLTPRYNNTLAIQAGCMITLGKTK